ncbi:hypothetical protein BD779DRAFT_1508385 [Infundibulicybe gibba]|nr:hypothetical protein BD779DRAFT_1508385 [Infundibulicybe gibba]
MATKALPDTIAVGKGISMTFLRNQPYLARVEIGGGPDDDALVVPLHWHETHDEYIHVLEGRLEITLGSHIKSYDHHDGPVCIRKGVVHGLRSARGVRCVFEEKTEPMDEHKEIFFRNLVRSGKQATNVFEAMQVFYHGDTRPAFPIHIMWLEKMFVSVVGNFLAPMLGYERKLESLKKA